jgi:hypothetical protein
MSATFLVFCWEPTGHDDFAHDPSIRYPWRADLMHCDAGFANADLQQG